MKRYLKVLPVILYPYAYMIWFAFLCVGSEALEKVMESEKIGAAAIIIGILYQFVVLADVIYTAVTTAVNQYTAFDVAKLNLVIKAWQIPAYLLHFVLGVAGSLMSVWGIGIVLFAIVIDLITILLTGSCAIGCVIKMKKQNVLTTPLAVLAAIGSFVYCVDVVVAIVLVCVAKKISAEDNTIQLQYRELEG